MKTVLITKKIIVIQYVTKQFFSVNDLLKQLVPLKSVNDVVRFTTYRLNNSALINSLNNPIFIKFHKFSDLMLLFTLNHNILICNTTLNKIFGDYEALRRNLSEIRIQLNVLSEQIDLFQKKNVDLKNNFLNISAANRKELEEVGITFR